MVIKDIKKNLDFAHWRAHTTQVLKFSFSSSGQKVLTSTLGSNTFHIWDLINMNDKRPNLVYTLSRGYTPASIYDISWTKNDSWVSISTTHGTSHLYFLKPVVLQTSTKLKANLTPEIRVRRPLDLDRRDFLSYSTAFINPIEIIDDIARLVLVSALSNDTLTADTFEITGTFDSVTKIFLVHSKHVPIEKSEEESEAADLSAQLTAISAKINSDNAWHSLVSIESYQSQPFWSLNHMSFSTFEDDMLSLPFQKNFPDLSEFPGIKPFSMIESVALPNG